MNFKLWSVAILAGVMTWAHDSQASVILSTTSYSENFNTLSTTDVNDVWSTTAGTQAAVPGSTGCDGVKLSGTSSGTGTNLMDFIADAGTSNTGAVHSYGAAANSERALGTVASGPNVPGIGVEIQNNTGTTITSVTINYTGEFWRSSQTVQNVLTFGYFIGASGSTTYLSAGGATAVTALNLVGPAAAGSAAALDGNLVGNQASFGSTITANILQGQSLYLRWQDADDTGNDGGVAIDGFSLTATLVPEPSGLALLGFGTFAMIRFRRRGA